ncbi:Antitoxin component YafN of the YafNO toxin-antitoxin module, PHD/YefM family [Paramicrobacterium humi]|uniref:Antitoxin component YafN of the YafNO toxin-antitoxin module, PHD/YefM family n=1 Tax=Paramicrobacterium humi TaxID=640635 RepID=A0A1H4NFY0_9MICO|nr:type II toxin-antitoxin system Phd/YefM family antitoxin [Microbacterium humi]SEB94190.1 Antitoxin component YafN of the YafNO toxin-antitoxin module, PHD/YefM family [Microbacterium humi]
MSMTVHTTSDARSGLNSVLKRFREKGITAEPLVFGSHRKPEAVVVPFELFERLLPALEEVLLADKVRERLDDPRPSESFDDVARAVGIDPGSF